MKKSKLSQKLILITLVCLMMSGLTVGVLGDITEKVRPIEEWGEVNPGLGAWLVWPRAFFSND